MQTPSVSPKETLRGIRILFYSLIVGMLIFTAIIFALNFLQTPAFVDRSVERVFLIAVLFIAAISITSAIRLYNKRLAEIRDTPLSLMNKLDMYRAALILYLALCEGAGLFATIVYFLTANKLLLIVIAIALLAMLQKRPEKFKIFNELQLSSEEQSELN